MSRLAKQPITVPAGVTVALGGGELEVRGPAGQLRRRWPERVAVEVRGEAVQLMPNLPRQEQALAGTAAAHLKNMIKGVTAGFAKKLLIEGIGYKAAVAGDKMVLNLGFSHPVEMPIPAGLKVAVEKNTQITISGIDKELVGQFAASVRALKKPEPYKGKGIRYEGEVVRRKLGKKAVAAA